MNYDSRNPFVICSRSMTPIYKGSDLIRCGYCRSAFLPKFKGKLCNVCNISRIGQECVGIQVFPSVSKKGRSKRDRSEKRDKPTHLDSSFDDDDF